MSANGERVVCRDGRLLRTYEVATGRPLAAVEGGVEPWGMLSGDGRLLVGTTGAADAFGVWDAAGGRLLARLCFPEAVDISSMKLDISDD
jgi:hypothetical protein